MAETPKTPTQNHPPRVTAQPRAARDVASEPLRDPLQEPDPTHVLARARRAGGFSRSGIRWSTSYQAVAVEDFKRRADEQTKANGEGVRPVDFRTLIKAVLDEPMLDARLIDADEAAQYAGQRAAVLAGEVSIEQLFDAYTGVMARCEELERKIEQLQARLYGGPPPARAEDIGEPVAPGR